MKRLIVLPTLTTLPLSMSLGFDKVNSRLPKNLKYNLDHLELQVTVKVM